MSRLVHSSSHRPIPFLPPSPPETDSEFIAPARVAMPVPIQTPQDIQDNSDASFHSMNFDPYHSRPKKSSSLSYNNSGIRESRERTVQRSLKSFIIVLPPLSVLEEHGQLGATLSSGPPHRLSQGILMPLFPTMYGQLTAIAREFNFPSTTGICLYFHYTDGGITLTPRIGEESWTFLWSQAFDATRTTGFPPISGRIEFDIDLRQARWYPAWVSARDRVTPASPPTRPPSRLHRRSDSRTAYDEDRDDSSVHNSLTVTRHVPKKLSLIDRFDSASSVRSPSRAQSHSLSPPARLVTHALSPIPQATEPPSAKVELETRVNNWRASASLKPTTLAATNGQTSLEPANFPNTLEIDAILEDHDARSELNLDDFTWSISSVGPVDHLDGASIAPSYRLPSVHLANRAEGSVCMTASECTSFGPSDYDMEYVEYPPSVRVPTPDVAMRMYEDCPPTPTTATSWGAPLSYPPSPVSYSRPPSVDLAAMYLHSRPVTPTTATSWGAPLSYPPTPTTISRAPSVDLAARFMHSRPVTPTTATSWGPPSWPASPALSDEFRAPSIHMADRGETSRPVSPVESVAPWRFVWPYHRADEAGPWPHVWPYTLRRRASRQEEEQVEDETPLQVSSEVPVEREEEDHKPWAHVWPYTQKPEPVKPWRHVWPYTHKPEPVRPWRHVWPYSKAREVSVAVRPVQEIVPLASTYPVFNLYPAVYPHFDLYPPPVRVEVPVHLKSVSVSLSAYPSFNLYPAVYPHFNLYPAVHAVERPVKRAAQPKEIKKGDVVVKLVASYPAFDLYPSVYPHNLEKIYTFSRVEADRCEVSSTQAVSRYPFFELYAPVYPCIRPYPSMPGLVEVKAKESRVGRQVEPIKEIIVALPAVYPHFDLYPSGYPHNVVSIYGRSSSVQIDKREVSMEVKSQYPFFRLYEPVYPYIQPYPSIPGQVESAEELSKQVTVAISLPYPDNLKQIYPSVSGMSKNVKEVIIDVVSAYPNFVLYPSVRSGQHEDVKQVVVNVVSAYPTFVLYPSVYPYNVERIYAPISGQCEDTKRVVVDIVSGYPNFVLYRSVYPYNLDRIYTPISGQCEDFKQVVVNIVSGYPNFVLYTSVYPYNLDRIYAPISGECEDPKQVVVDIASPYPSFVIYPSVYPHNLQRIYHSATVTVEYPMVLMELSHRYPIFQLYAPVYPHIIPYPQASASVEPLAKTAVEHPHHPSKAVQRKTHSELHAAVFGNGPVNTPSGTPQPHLVSNRNTHAQLHASVFGDGPVSTPSGTTIQRPIRPRVDLQQNSTLPQRLRGYSPISPPPRRALPSVPADSASPQGESPVHSPVRVRPYRMSSTPRPSLPLPPVPSQPSPTRKLPTPPTPPLRSRTLGRRMSISETDMSDLPPARPRGLPSTPRQAPRPQSAFETSSTEGVQVARRTSSLEHLGRSRSLANRSLPREGIQRSQTMVLPISPVREQIGDEVFEMMTAHSLPRAVAPPPTHMGMVPKRRDSLVSRRVRAFSSTSQGDDLSVRQTLNEFPEPPKKVSTVSRLDRSKYTAFS